MLQQTTTAQREFSELKNLWEERETLTDAKERRENGKKICALRGDHEWQIEMNGCAMCGYTHENTDALFRAMNSNEAKEIFKNIVENSTYGRKE